LVNLNKTIPYHLKNLRKKKGVTMAQLAEAVGVTKSTISDWENAKKLPKTGCLKKLADFYEVSMEDLVTDKSEVERAELPFSTSIIDLEKLLNSNIRLVMNKKVLSAEEKQVSVRVLKAVIGGAE